jgi:hypothetical protein
MGVPSGIRAERLHITAWASFPRWLLCGNLGLEMLNVKLNLQNAETWSRDHLWDVGPYRMKHSHSSFNHCRQRPAVMAQPYRI